MYRDHLDGDRFFARVRDLDLACPDCDTVYITRRNRTVYDPSRALFHCAKCGSRFVVGVYLYRTSRLGGRPAHVHRPDDQIPTLEESAQLRGNLPNAPSPGRPPLAPGEKGAYPKTRRPSAKQLRLRAQRAARALDSGGGLLDSGDQIRKRGAPTNIVVRGECRCEVDEVHGALFIQPGCPIHSSSRRR